ncbi:PP2C family protein-serine/threonine phosphatase [Streptomonospora salina]|uniref:Serine phosphatase RsbU (Regulator of sigma subunit) n=1 Tax=Streptomonospora salina TaxID=104205 RepID=A0A841E8M5_9ACTN|nr:PP2C family protein-serine/threonine phosphatase [Streptomonospora salina]MBB5999272.1 serine phosphatase RsbU (regulator of sigma subunit) [Streptomonospora salina]
MNEPMLLVALSGEILGRNAAMRRLCPGADTGANLYGISSDSPELVGDTLRRWARAGEPRAGVLALVDPEGRPRRCPGLGNRAAWADTGEPAVQIRLVPALDRGDGSAEAAAEERERRLRARLEREHEIALGLQRSLLPCGVDDAPLEVAAEYVPTAFGAEVGGDWYDVFPVAGTDRVGLVIGDVAGHGLPEATVMSQLRSVLRAAALEEGARPDRVAARLDAYVDTYLPESMATMCYAVYDPGTEELAYANAGHVPPMLLRGDGTCERLEAVVDPPLGCSMGGVHRTARVAVHPGDMLVCYTDGVVEQRRESLDTGLNRLSALLTGFRGPTPKDVCAGVMAWSERTDHADDRAVLVAGL